jgi:hypothetical protein
MDRIAETLQADFDAFINQPQPFGFYSGLSDYVGYVLRTATLKTIVDTVMQERQKLLDEYDGLQEQTLKEMKASEKKIREIIKNNNIDPASITMVFTSGPSTHETHNLLERLEELDRSHPGHGSRKWRTYGEYLFDIAVNLSKQGYNKQLKEFTVSGSEWGRRYEDPYPEDNTSGIVITGNVHGNFVFSKTEPLVYKLDARIDKGRQFGSMWGVFDRLIKLYEVFSARSEGINKYEFLNDYTQRHPTRNEVEANDMWDVNLAFDELADLSEDERDRALPRSVRSRTEFLHINEFKGLASRAHRYLLKELAATEAISAMKEGVSFDVGKGLLRVGDKDIKFRKFTEQYHTLRLAFSDVSKDWLFSEMAETIDHEKGYTDKDFHNYLSAIKRRVSADTGIKDLFITTTQSVRINPEYLN